MIQYAALTDVGKRRKQNEDSLLAQPEAGLFLVADGVGGRAAGEVASAETVRIFDESAGDLRGVLDAYAQEPKWATRNAVLDTLSSVCQAASRRVYEESQTRELSGMSSTLVVCLVGGGAAFLAHAGDSRAYLVRDGILRQLTEDHSMVNDMIRSGQLTPEEARGSKYRSVITRAVGQYPTIQVDLMAIEILPGDRIVLCSDGLCDPVPGELIEEIASRGDVQSASQSLIQAALDRGAPDNVTVVLVEPEASAQTQAVRARAQILERLFLFEGLPFHAQLRVSRICEEVFFAPEDVLVEQGAPGDSMFVIVEGNVVVSGDGVELATLGPGEHFGEVALIDEQPRSARVQASTFGSAVVVNREQLRDFCRRDPQLGTQLLWKLLATVSGRLRDANRALARR